MKVVERGHVRIQNKKNVFSYILIKEMIRIPGEDILELDEAQANMYGVPQCLHYDYSSDKCYYLENNQKKIVEGFKGFDYTITVE